MAKKIKKWNPTCKRFVAFLDIMGFRDMVFRESHTYVKKILTSFYPAVEAIEWAYGIKVKDRKVKTNTKPIIFSDSIILVSRDNSVDSIFDIIVDVGWVISNAVIEKIPMKGAIAYGEQTADFKKSLHFGRPLIDAYELQDELLFYGVVLHHTMEKQLIVKRVLEKYVNNLLVKYPVPMKSGKINHYALDWISDTLNEEKVIKALPEFSCLVSGSPRQYVDNTLDFVRWITEKKAELKQKKETSKS